MEKVQDGGESPTEWMLGRGRSDESRISEGAMIRIPKTEWRRQGQPQHPLTDRKRRRTREFGADLDDSRLHTAQCRFATEHGTGPACHHQVYDTKATSWSRRLVLETAWRGTGVSLLLMQAWVHAGGDQGVRRVIQSQKRDAIRTWTRLVRDDAEYRLMRNTLQLVPDNGSYYV